MLMSKEGCLGGYEWLERNDKKDEHVDPAVCMDYGHHISTLRQIWQTVVKGSLVLHTQNWTLLNVGNNVNDFECIYDVKNYRLLASGE